MPISQPTKAPPPITAATWHSTNANDILRFLVSIQGVFLYYKVLGVDPNPDASTAQEEEAMSVDVITRRQRKEFLAQKRLIFSMRALAPLSRPRSLSSLPSAKHRASPHPTPSKNSAPASRELPSSIPKLPRASTACRSYRWLSTNSSAPWQLPTTRPQLVEFLLPALHVALTYYVS